LFTEPQRLWERYIVGNPLFFYRLLKQRITKGSRKRL
jgi:N-acetylglucosaminyldiphosphoundecaprenol N-acetyl-beta-D-mannosaminyltransferase